MKRNLFFDDNEHQISKKHKNNDSDKHHSHSHKDSHKDSHLDCSDSKSSSINNVFSENNHIYFNSSVNKKSVEMLINEINDINEKFLKLKQNKLLKSIKTKPIYLHITSYGGSLLHCFKAIDAIQSSSIRINTIVEGYVASAGSLMAICGKKRYMGKYASHLIHQLSSHASGKFMEIEDDYHNCKMWMSQITNIYKQYSNMDEEFIQKQMKHDIWWNYDDCLKYGLVDKEWKNK